MRPASARKAAPRIAGGSAGSVRPDCADKRFTSAYLYAAVCPANGADFALVMPAVSTAAMSVFLDGFSKSLEADVQAVLVLDQAG